MTKSVRRVFVALLAVGSLLLLVGEGVGAVFILAGAAFGGIVDWLIKEEGNR